MQNLPYILHTGNKTTQDFWCVKLTTGFLSSESKVAAKNDNKNNYIKV